MIPVAGLIGIGIVTYGNVHPTPPSPLRYFIWATVATIIASIVVAIRLERSNPRRLVEAGHLFAVADEPLPPRRAERLSGGADGDQTTTSDGRVATITLDRPEALNAMDTRAYREITEAMRLLDGDEQVHVGIVTGAGRAFSAGADLKEMHGSARRPESWEPWRAERWDLGLGVAKPLIAAIDGYALAGGLELALKCDIRVATPRSQFGAPEIRWNLLHGYGALRLPGLVGMGNAMMLLLTGEFIDAEEALRIGLVNRIVEPEELLPAANSVAEVIAGHAVDAVRMTKELALFGVDAPIEQALRLYHSYMESLEGGPEQLSRTGAFAEGRDPADAGGS